MCIQIIFLRWTWYLVSIPEKKLKIEIPKYNMYELQNSEITERHKKQIKTSYKEIEIQELVSGGDVIEIESIIKKTTSNSITNKGNQKKMIGKTIINK